MGSTVPWGKIAVLHEKMIAGFEKGRLPCAGPAGSMKPRPALHRAAHRCRAQPASSSSVGWSRDKGPQDALEATRAAGVPLEVIGDDPMRTELELMRT